MEAQLYYINCTKQNNSTDVRFISVMKKKANSGLEDRGTLVWEWV